MGINEVSLIEYFYVSVMAKFLDVFRRKILSYTNLHYDFSCLQNMKHPQPMTRVPSLSFLFALMAAQETNEKSVSKTGVRDENIFYVLNPDKNYVRHNKDLKYLSRI